MVKSEILFKTIIYFVTVIGFVFSFLAYTIVIRPQIQKVTNEYTLGFIEGGIIFFVIVGLPLTYIYFVEREKKKKKLSKKTI